jgi:hypothetical protein
MRGQVEVPPWATPLPDRHIDDVLRHPDPVQGPAGETPQHLLQRAEAFYRREGFEVERVMIGVVDGVEAWLPRVKMPDDLQESVRLLKAHRRFSGGLHKRLEREGMLLVPPSLARELR